jgi:hypothetical protein
MFNRSTNKLTTYNPMLIKQRNVETIALELAPQIEKCTAEELADSEFRCRKEE